MKRIAIVLFLAILSTVIVSAQNVSPKKAVKEAKKSLRAFEMDNEKVDALKAGTDLVLSAVRSDEMKNDPSAWNLLGDLYNSYLELDYKNSLMDEGYKAQYLQEANKAYMAYRKGYEVADKKKDKSYALKGMAGLIQSMSNSGISVLQAGDAMGAYNIMRSVLDIHDLLKKEGEDSPLNNQESYNNQLFLTGYAALLGEQYEVAAPYYNELQANNYDDPALYEGLYKIKDQDDPAAAERILDEGRQKYPEDLTLLYAEINAALQKNDIGSLEGKLKNAINKDPENMSLYTTTGSVYDRLFQEKMDSDPVAAAAYFDSAKVYFEKALEKDPDNVDAIYSIGALYYNKAAQGTQELQALGDDYSTEGTRKYNEKKKEVDAVFDQALPYFQKAERVNPGDRNTLIALKEIYARRDQMDVSEEFNRRLQEVEAGKSVNDSYFKSNE